MCQVVSHLPVLDQVEEGNFSCWTGGGEEQGSLRDVPLPWRRGEPNGNRYENCTLYNQEGVDDRSCNDIPYCFYCQFEGSVGFRIRGLCENSLFDSSYTLIRDGRVGEFYWRGLQGKSSVVWGEAENSWTLAPLVKDSSTSGVYRGHWVYPMGHHTWEIAGDRCQGGPGAPAEESRTLSFSRCSLLEYACDDGTCLSMDLRCDSKADCDDFSDERDCKMIEVDASYMKEKIPPKLGGEEGVPVTVNMELISILNIDVVGGKLHAQIQLSLAWKDPRVVFKNLKTDRNLNILSPKEQTVIWIPEVIFKNTETRLVSINDAKTFIAVDQEGGFKWIDDHILDNVFLYRERSYSKPKQ